MKILTVIPLKKKDWKQNLTYFSAQDIQVGRIVKITIKNKETLGLVVGSDDLQNVKSEVKGMDFNLKKIVEAKERSVFSEAFMASISSTAKYFVQKETVAFANLIPAVLKEEYDQISTFLEKRGNSKNPNIAPPPITPSSIKSEKVLLQNNLEDRVSFYKTLIRESFAQKKSIFMVLPTERDITVFQSLLTKGIEQFVVNIHGGLSPKKQLQKIESLIESDHAMLILGTAPYLAMPIENLATIIIEKESSSAYKMLSRPFFDLRTFVEIFASYADTKLIFADTILRFETSERRHLEHLGEAAPLSFRINFEGEIMVSSKKDTLNEDARGDTPSAKKNKFQVLRDSTYEEIQRAVARKKNVFIFSLRKGLASYVLCGDCKDIFCCDNCNSPMSLFASSSGQQRKFVCNKCGANKDALATCKDCGSWNLVPLGIGVDTVIAELKERFSENNEVKILKIDKETAKTKRGAERIIKEFEKEQGAILVGTELGILSLNTPTPLSVVASFDSLWSIPSFKINEKVVQLVYSMMQNTEDKLIIETNNPEDTLLRSMSQGNILPSVKEDLEDRKVLEYPPFKRFIKISCLEDKDKIPTLKAKLKEIFDEYIPQIWIGAYQKSKNKYVLNVLIKISPTDWNIKSKDRGTKSFERLFAKLTSLPSAFAIVVDPEDLS